MILGPTHPFEVRMHRPRESSLLGPFFVAEAREAGVSWKALQTKLWIRLSRGQYVSSRVGRDEVTTLSAIARRRPSRFAFSGMTAAWLHGLAMTPCEPVEVTIDRDVPIRARAGVKVRRAALQDCDVVAARGFHATSPLRTVRDLGSLRDTVESVVAIDMALHKRLVQLEDIVAYIDAHAGDKGIKRLRRAAALANARSESPMETRLRVELVLAGLPTPCVQADLHDASGRFLGRADLYYPERRLAIEYDGDNHRERLASDMRRQNALLSARYDLLRFTAADLRTPMSVVAIVRDALVKARQESA
jgi:hypothetical protein